MSFTQMHNDYLDPDRHAPVEDYGFDHILAALKEHDSARWDWDRIDCCITGKNADIDITGQQGIHLDNVDEEHVFFTVHTGLSVAGTDVSLPDIDGETDEEYEARREAYLDVAQELVSDFGYSGDWSGDDWYFHDEAPARSPVFLTEEGEIDVKKTVAGILAVFDQTVAPWDEACIRLQQELDEASGWKKAE